MTEREFSDWLHEKMPASDDISTEFHGEIVDKARALVAAAVAGERAAMADALWERGRQLRALAELGNAGLGPVKGANDYAAHKVVADLFGHEAESLLQTIRSGAKPTREKGSENG